MLDSLTHYLHERRRGLGRAAGYAGAAYLLTRYVRERLDDVRITILQDRLARDNLRRRFAQNQDDAAFTVMALLPTLARHVLAEMDVEGITQELKALSNPPAIPPPPPPPPPPSESSLASSVELVRDSRSEEDGILSLSVVSSVPGDTDTAYSDLGASSSSWVDQLPSMQSSQASNSTELPETAVDQQPPQPQLQEAVARQDSPTSNGATNLADSITTVSSASSAALATSASSPPESIISDAMTSVTKSKAELWREVKLLTFTRTLTVLYSVTLLAVFTHIQLNIVGRAKYIQSVVQLEQDERTREDLAAASIFSLFFAGTDDDDEPSPAEDEAIGEETEQKYLTLSWWILHVGWKDVGERVRRAVEEVFEGVSLKTKFSLVDIHRLISDVRRRIEYEVTFEGKERRINFMSTLLPPTPETLQHVLTQGGIPLRVASAPDMRFHALIAETRAHLQSASFARVLEVALDNATETLLAGVGRHVFGGAAGGSERLAGMLPGLASWSHLALEGLPNELVDGLASLREVEALSAIVYADYGDLFC